MKTEKILTKLNEILPKSIYHAEVYRDIEALIAELSDDLRKEIAAAAGTGSIQRAAAKILRGMKNEPRESLKYAWIDSSNRQCICTGYIAVRMKEHQPLEPRPESAGTPINLDEIMNPLMNCHEFIDLDLPSIPDLKTHIALEKSKCGKYNDPKYCFGDGLPVVNPCLLLDVMSVFPLAKTIAYNPKKPFSPLYLSCEAGDAVVLPVRVSQQEDRDLDVRNLHCRLSDIKASSAADPNYTVTPEQFEELVAMKAKIA